LSERHGQLIEVEEVELVKGRLICGFPGPGLVGSLAAKYVAGYLNMREVAYLRLRTVPPVSMFYEGELKHPFRLYAEPKRRLAVFIAETPILGRAQYEVAEALTSWAERKGLSSVICMESLPAKDEGSRRVYGVAEAKTLREMMKRGIEPLSMGLVAGVSAAIMNECLIKKVEGVCLFAEADVNKVDVEATVSLIEALNKLLRVDVDIKPLLNNVANITSQLEGLIEHVKRVSEERGLAMYA